MSELERAFGLPQPQRELGALFLARAGVEEPQQQRARRFGRRRRPAANLEHPAGAVRPHLARDPAGGRAGRFHFADERLKILGDNPAVVTGQFGKTPRLSAKAELAYQLRIGLDPSVCAQNERPRRRKFEQPRIRLRGGEHLLRQREAPGGDKRDRHSNAQPEQSQRDDRQNRA